MRRSPNACEGNAESIRRAPRRHADAVDVDEFEVDYHTPHRPCSQPGRATGSKLLTSFEAPANGHTDSGPLSGLGEKPQVGCSRKCDPSGIAISVTLLCGRCDTSVACGTGRNEHVHQDQTEDAVCHLSNGDKRNRAPHKPISRAGAPDDPPCPSLLQLQRDVRTQPEQRLPRRIPLVRHIALRDGSRLRK